MTTPTPLQQFFDRGYLGLQSQGFLRSTREAEHCATAASQFCMYRGPNNRKCFVGWNIDDVDYKPVMDNAIWSLGDFQAHGMFTDISNEDFNSLQHIHDAALDPADMKMQLEAYALKRGLILPTTTTSDRDAA